MYVSNLPIFGHFCHPIFAHPNQKTKQPNKRKPNQAKQKKKPHHSKVWEENKSRVWGRNKKKWKKIKEVVWNKGGNMKAADTGRDPVTLSAMEQFVDDEMRIYQDPYASSIKKTKRRLYRALRS